jgi:hypothetical protein
MEQPAFIQPILLSGLLLWSIADLKYRVIPLVEIAFFGAVLLAINNGNWVNLISVVLAVTFGSLVWIPNCLGWLFLILPSAWPAFLIGSGVRKQVVGRADLFVMGIISCAFTLDIAVVAFVGMVAWSKWWVKAHVEDRHTPLVPGMLLGSLFGIGIRSILKYWFLI